MGRFYGGAAFPQVGHADDRAVTPIEPFHAHRHAAWAARAVTGQLLAFAGPAIALAPAAGPTRAPSGEVWLGYLEVGITVLCGASYNVWSRPLLVRYDALAITA